MTDSRTGCRRPQARAGYALLAMLWLSMGIAALAFAISEAAREALATSRNRIAFAQASWSAHACMAYVHAAVAKAFLQQGDLVRAPAPLVWHRMGRTLLGTALPPALSCRVSVRAVGSRLDVNAADLATITRFLRRNGVPDARADSAARAVVAHRPFASLREVRMLEGFDGIAALDSLLDVDSGPVALNHAPPEVLAALPGFTTEAVQRVMEARARDLPFEGFLEVSRALSPAARDTFDLAMPSLVGTISFEPRAWAVTARSSAGRPPVTAVLELQIGHSEGRAGITRRRSWTQ